MTAKRWIGLGVITMLLAAGLHGLIVWLIPHAITFAFVRGVTKQVGYNSVFAPPLPTHQSRSVVAPSPDLLYSVCVFDVSAGPVRISVRRPQGYWSLSLFDRNSDNFYAINDSETKGDTVELILGLAPADPDIKAKFPSAAYVQTPRSTGVMLSRILVLDPANMQAERDAQSSVRCGAVADQG
jgi:uncharacterized membrane protein